MEFLFERRETTIQLLLFGHSVVCGPARIPLHPDATLHLPVFRLKRRLERARPGVLLARDAWQVAG